MANEPSTKPKITLKVKLDDILQTIGNKVTSWSNTPSNDKYPSEKLVKNSLDEKISKSNISGLIKNDGTIDTTQYLTSHQDISGKEDKSNKVTFLSSSSTDTQYPSAKAVYDAVNGFYTDLYDVMDCINVNFNNLDNIYLLDTVFNISNYNGLPSKNSSVVNDILRNNAVSGISLNKEFTPSTNYTLKFDYYTSVSNRNGFYFGADPSLENGVSINNSDIGLQVIVDVSNTYVETFNGTSSPTNVYTHTSNLLTEGTHHIKIVRDGSNATFYIDDVELYTYTNAKYNTIGLNKWSSGYNTISNIEIKIGD